MDVAVDKRRPEMDTDMEDTMDAGLKPRTRHQYSDVVVPDVPKVENGDGKGKLTENSTYLDIQGAFEDLDMHKILNVVHQNNAKEKEEREIVNASSNKEGSTSTKSTPQQVIQEEDQFEEEEVELEFVKGMPKLDTDTTAHCPNCKHQITKVILRRKIKRPPAQVTIPHKPLDLLGCFSCFSVFFPSDNGRFNPFPIFGNKPDDSIPPISREDGSCFSIFRVFRKEKDIEKVDRGHEQPESHNLDSSFEQVKPAGNIGRPPPSTVGDNIKYTTGKPPISGTNLGGTYNQKDQLPTSHPGPGEQPGKDETSIDMPPQTSNEVPSQPQTAVGQDSTSFEILKSVVYGGLMEVIASLSVVASAAAGDASTLSIIALAVANLIGGVIVVCHNLWDLRDDCFKYSSQQTSDQEARNKYKELLGRVEHFPMHLFFAILSFLVFGIIPPLAYGYAFHETSDKDFTIAVVAIASLVGVALLAIFKAYIDRCDGFAGYFKTITYYLTTAVAVSGVSYVAGNLAMRLIEKLGLFETASGVAMSFLPEVVSANPSLAYY
uniref:uncharacterized protein LOC122581821 n=1 Tax=Erigeron canadensis TaxID=72917 RepID=UPI001CB8D8F4|nr:uncharacterized protein LOC122581821 [Erigeron canadensis]